MRTDNRSRRQLGLEELFLATPKWGDLPAQTRTEVLELVAQVLIEHAARQAKGGDDE